MREKVAKQTEAADAPRSKRGAAPGSPKAAHAALRAPAQPRPVKAASFSPAPASLSLPKSLEPSGWSFSGKTAYVPEVGWVRATDDVIQGIHKPLRPVPHSELRAVSACTAGILEAAKSRGAVRSEATRAVTPGRRAAGLPLVVRVTYPGLLTSEVRQAQVGCQLNKAGRVVGLAAQ